MAKNSLWTRTHQHRKQQRYPLLALGVLCLLGTSTVAAQAAFRQQLPLQTPSELSCQDPGTPQEGGKTLVITNTSDTPLAKGLRITWSASDGDTGQVVLSQELPSGKTIQVKGRPGSRYTCQAVITS